MATYLLFGKYSLDSIKEISSERSKKASEEVAKNGGNVHGGYALLGEYDIVLIVDFPGTEQAIKTSVALAKMLKISFTTSPAVSIEEFDRLIGK